MPDFAVVLPVIQPTRGERVVEYVSCSLEGDAMPRVVRSRLGVVSFEVVIAHADTATP